MSEPEEERFNRFTLKRRLGRGGMGGTVDLAYDPKRDRLVALKRLPLDHPDSDALAAERRGAELQERFSKVARQVVEVFERMDLDGYFCVVMEYIDGPDLAQILEESAGPLDTDRALSIGLQLCQMLVIAHHFFKDLVIFHGDLKPENIKILPNDQVRVLDFGASKDLALGHKYTRNLFGTYPYVPPEQIKSGGLANARSDLWALGIILYRMVTGQAPYGATDPTELQRQIIGGHIAPVPADCPPHLETILLRALARREEQRYPSARELRSDLLAVRDGRPPAPWPDAVQPGQTWKPGAPPPVPGDPSPHHPGPRSVETEVREDSLSAAPAPAPTPDSPSVPGSEAPRHRGPIARTRAAITSAHGRWVLLILLLTLISLSQAYVRATGMELRRQIATQAIDLDAAWAKYRSASRLTIFDLGIEEAKNSLHAATLSAVDRILATFRQDRPTTRQADWRRAHDYLQRVLYLKSSDPAARAKLIYAQAQLDRIEAGSLREKKKTDLADRKVNEAINGFLEAGQLASDWPDPFLGLARIYAYDRFDLEALESALDESAGRGYPPRNREKAQRADGHATNGGILYEQALETSSIERQCALLRDAADDLDIAVQVYEEILNFAKARANRRASLRSIDKIEARIKKLGCPGSEATR